jgi:short-subunit dehydrogenase|tara:strand:+ start:98 stop:835 length:738 start_codon:yes stop_codon:yes gene_type:complete
MKYLIIGASSGLGRELAYEYARNKHNLILVSRDLRDLTAIKSDLEKKFEIKIQIVELDLTSESQIEKELFIEKFLNEINGILFPIGMMFNDDEIVLDQEKINKIFKSNFTSVAFIISKFINFLSSKEGEIVGFGSISGHLGRKINPYYAASKRALESYFESLGFFSNKSGLKVQFYVLGYLDTNLAFGKKLNLPKASPKKLAKIVYENRKAKFKKIYYPKLWRLVAIILVLIPIKIIFLLDKLFK